jgi:hypothetical protein
LECGHKDRRRARAPLRILTVPNMKELSNRVNPMALAYSHIAAAYVQSNRFRFPRCSSGFSGVRCRYF